MGVSFTMVTTNTKQPAESRLYNFDFTAKLAEAGASVTVASAAAASALVSTISQGVANGAALTVGSPALSSPNVQVRLSGGTAGENYRVLCRVNDSAGNTLEIDGFLKVED